LAPFFSQNAPLRPRATSSSQGSSGTDTETRTLLTNTDKPKVSSTQTVSTGAIPKRRGSNDARRNSSNSRVESPLHFVDDDLVDDFECRDDEKGGQVALFYNAFSLTLTSWQNKLACLSLLSF